MNDLILMLSAVIPSELIIEHLEKSIADYKADPSEERKKMIGSCCAMFMSKMAVDHDPRGVDGVIDRSNRIDALSKLADIKEQ